MGEQQMIHFNIPVSIGDELKYIQEAIDNKKISGDGIFTEKCSIWLKENTQSLKVLFTTSCTHALEMAAVLLGIKEGDEIIMPSYTFVSTANAFVLRGAKIIFVDIRPDTMNMDEKLIENAITSRTKAIVPVHYAGVSCEMNQIMDIAHKYNVYVVEDAAQGMMSKYYGRPLGSIGTLGSYSFHETKNYTMGEGGALLINDQCYEEQAEIIREKGTNRKKFFRGEVDKYSWVDIGSSYLPSEINAAYLWAQLEKANEILENRLNSWQLYYDLLYPLMETGRIELPVVPKECSHNAHIFYIKLKNITDRTKLIKYLHENNVNSVYHYVPLHSAQAGLKYSSFSGTDHYTTNESERILRLPMYYGLKADDVKTVVSLIETYCKLNK
jgi:dTDP-4-amino-4,6-dideoxygalactose transaminase